MAVPPPATAKAELREAALETRKAYAAALTEEARIDLEERLIERLAERLAGFPVIGVYHPMKAEISVMRLPEILPTAIFAWPWFAHRDALMMYRQGPVADAGPWRILQPPPDAPPATPRAVVVPVVMIDRAGNRIGHGKGHYDRALANLREAVGEVFTVGVGWDVQLSETPIAPDAWDVPLDAVATPSQWIDCRG